MRWTWGMMGLTVLILTTKGLYGGMMNRVTKAGLLYAQMGFAVLPLKGKVPLTKHGYKDATKDPDQISLIFNRDCNIGIATGRVSGVIVLDIDPRNGGMGSWDRLGLTPDTPMAFTGGGGIHVYFQYQEMECKKELLPGIDIKSDGGFVVAPPSSTDKEYRWHSLYRPDKPFQQLPERIIQMMKKPSVPKGDYRPTGHELQDKILSYLGPYRVKGSEYIACCPVHEERTPSFSVNFEKGMFQCFSCDFKGRVPALLEVLEGTSEAAHAVRKLVEAF